MCGEKVIHKKEFEFYDTNIYIYVILFFCIPWKIWMG